MAVIDSSVGPLQLLELENRASSRSIALVAPPRPAATLAQAAQLVVADHCQNCPGLLVVSDGALVDLANLVEGCGRSVATRLWRSKIGRRGSQRRLRFADRRLGLLAWLQNEYDLVVLQGQRL
jgi:hypothetical protein